MEKNVHSGNGLPERCFRPDRICMDLERLMEGIGLDEAAKTQVRRSAESSSDCRDFIDELKSLFHQNEQAFLDMLSVQPDRYRIALTVFLELAAEAYDEYVRRCIPDRIYFDTMEDIAIWERECLRKHGVHGLEETAWLTRHLRLDLFCLGRLQFEPVLTEEEYTTGSLTWHAGTLALNVHITEGRPLDIEECRKSFCMARDFFGSCFELFICDSWLLSPELAGFLPDSSNILSFQKLFSVVKVHYSFPQAEQRIFKDVLEDKTKYPEDTSLQRMTRQYFIDGNDPGIGIGVIPALRCMPFMSEFKCTYCKVSPFEYSHDPELMAETEIAVYNRFRPDRIVIGPNTRGIAEALGAEFKYPENGVPYTESPLIDSIDEINNLSEAGCPAVYEQAAKILNGKLPWWVRREMSIGGPFTIASMLMGAEHLLRACRKSPSATHCILRKIADTQKKCIDTAARNGFGIAMADPVANPGLIGPKMYEEFVFPYSMELTEYALAATGKKVSLHMCGNTYSIWKYLVQYPIGELSLDNIIDMERAAAELGPYIRIAGNVDPVGIILNGSREEINADVMRCVLAGRKAGRGYTLASGCDIPESTDPARIDWFMKAARNIPAGE